MEWIGIGIAIAIGFYIAPLVLGFFAMGIGAIAILICKLFGGCR